MIHTSRRQPTYRNHKLRGALGSCCSSCAEAAQTGPPIGPPHTHTHGCGSCSGGSLGTVTCDQDNNCYNDATGVYTPAPTFDLSAGIGPNVNSAGTWLSQNSTTLAALAAIAGIAAFALGKK